MSWMAGVGNVEVVVDVEVDVAVDVDVVEAFEEEVVREVEDTGFGLGGTRSGDDTRNVVVVGIAREEEDVDSDVDDDDPDLAVEVVDAVPLGTRDLIAGPSDWATAGNDPTIVAPANPLEVVETEFTEEDEPEAVEDEEETVIGG